MIIMNPYSDNVYIGGSSQPYKPCNHAAEYPIDPDTNLYVYYPTTENYLLDVTVGEASMTYRFVGDR